MSWTELPIREIAVDIFDGPHATPKKTIAGPIFLGISNLNNGRLALDDVEHLSDEDYIKWTRRVVPQAGDIVFSYETRLGQAALIPEGLKCCLGRRMALIRPDRSKVVPEFLLYAFLGPFFQKVIKERTITGSTVERIALKEFPNFPIQVPSLSEQNKIVDLLRALDNKIDLNNRMNETLEAMARAIFQSWFVDFDPVHAKVEGRQPWGMNAETTALFPSSCEETVDHIPANWTAGRLDSIATNPRSSISPQNIPSGTPYIGLEHMPRKSIALTEWELADGVESNKYQFKQGEYLFGKLRPYFHKVGIAPVSGVCSTDILVVVPKEPCWAAFVLMCISSDDFVAHTDRTSAGTKMPRTNWADMGMYEVTLPPKAIAEKFNQITMPMFEKIISNIHQSNTLADLRDTLLPKLIAGEILIKEAEQKIEEEIA